MKKWIGLVVAAVVIASLASFYIYQKFPKVEIAGLESIVPEDVIYYVYSYNLDKKIKELQASEFFKQVYSSAIYNKFINPKLEKIKDKIPILSELIQRDTAFAVLSFGKVKSRQEEIAELGNFLFLTRIDPKRHIRIKKLMADFYLSFTNKGNMSHKDYKGIRITEYRLSGKTLTVSYTLLSDVLVFSNSNEIIQKTIDLYRKESANNLLNSRNFQKVSARIKKDALFWGYGNSNNYYRQMLQEYSYESLRSRGSKDARMMDSLMGMKPFINLMNISEGYAFQADYDELKKGLVFKGFNVFNSAKDEDNFLGVILHNKEVDKNTFNLIPRFIIGYYAGTQDLNKTWQFFKKFYKPFDEMMKAEIKNDPRLALSQSKIEEMNLENLLNKVNSFLGINIENDILPLLGDNFGGVLVNIDDLNVQRMPPLIFPQGYGFIELKDSSKMDKLMQAIMQRVVDKVNQSIKEKERRFKEQSQPTQQDKEGQPKEEEKDFLQLKVDNYKGENIFTVEMLNFPIDFLRLNYCILDKYLIFSLSPNLTMSVIDVYKNKQETFNSNYAFESTRDKAPANYSNIIFFDSKKFIDNLKSTKFFSLLEVQLSRNTQKYFSKQDLDSVLNLLSNISVFLFTNRKLDAQTLESLCYIRIEGL